MSDNDGNKKFHQLMFDMKKNSYVILNEFEIKKVHVEYKMLTKYSATIMFYEKLSSI
jgi:hypothetical protein